MKNSKFFVMLVLSALLVMPAGLSFADAPCPLKNAEKGCNDCKKDGWGKSEGCSKSKSEGCSKSKSKCGKKECGKDGECPLEKKFFKKVKFLYKNQEALKLSEDQLAKMKEIKVDVKKDLIMKKAEIEVLMIDGKMAMKQSPIDVESFKKIIDQHSELEKQKAYKLIESYVEVKSLLTEEQMVKAKEIWKKDKK